MKNEKKLFEVSVAFVKAAVPDKMLPIARGFWKKVVPRTLRKRYYDVRRQGALSNDQRSLDGSDMVEPKPSAASPMLSVIIPCYNVEEYLAECLDSVLAQTYSKLEIIVVIDGATDNTGDIADRYAQKDSRIKVVRQENGGLSNARNTGLDVSSSEYVAFLDSDDWLAPDAYSLLMNALEASGSDVATGNVMRVQGKRRWQAWNQSYTHKDLHQTRTTTLAETPELLFDTTAWNKVYRKRLFVDSAIVFPEGKLYEDMHPTARAFIAARSVDIVPDVVYFYRVRDDKSSITQKRGEVKNLVDKLEMMRAVEKSLSESHYSDDVVQTVIFKALEGDLPVYSPFLGSDPDFDDAYREALIYYWNSATESTIERLTLERRVLFAHEVLGHNKKAASAESWVRNNFHSIPLLENKGRVVVNTGVMPEYLEVLDTTSLIDMSRYVVLTQAVTDVSIQDGILHLAGYAFLDYTPECMPSVTHLELVASDGTRVELPYRETTDERANGYWRSANASRACQAFEVGVPVGGLFGPSPRSQDWVLWITVSAGTYSQSVPATGFWRGGIARLGSSGELWRKQSAIVKWQPWSNPLTISVQDEGPELNHVRCSYSGSLHMEISWSEPVRSVHLTRGDNLRVNAVLEDRGDGIWVAHVSGSELKREKSRSIWDAWRIWLEADGKTSCARLAPSMSVGCDLRTGWQIRTQPSGDACIVDETSMLIVDDLTSTEGGWRLSGSCYYAWPDQLAVECVGAAGARFTSSIEVDEDERFVIDVACCGTSQGSAWNSDEYRIHLVNTKWGKAASGVRASVAVVRTMPNEDISLTARTRWHAVSDVLEMSLLVAPSRAVEERGRYNRERMIRHWKVIDDAEVRPEDAVLYSVDVGLGSADSARAICKEMQRRAPGLTHYWAVQDGTVRVPEGTIPVLRETEAWFEAINRARIVVNNYGGLLGYNARGFQYYVQTWHGTPLKTIGRSHNEIGDARSIKTLNDRSSSEASEWDLFVLQNPFMEQVARRELFYEGETIRSGYPRNDSLLVVDPEEDARERQELGIPARSRVVLYAPTWRDDGTGAYSQKMFSALDLDELATRLGSGWTVLLRGHSFNRRAGEGDHSRANIVDVTSHPDLNRLMRISDVLITDYSSIMFDYLVTRKPIIYFVPDLRQYCATRGMYFEYSEVLAGPAVSTLHEVVLELRSLGSFWKRYGVVYQRQVDRFVPWDDGRAAERVVDRIQRDIGGQIASFGSSSVRG